MTNGANQRQDAVRLISAAVSALRTTGALDADEIRALLAPWRSLSPAAHPGAGLDALDIPTLTRLAAWAPELLGARAFSLAPPSFRAPPHVLARDDGAVLLGGLRAADALIVSLTLSLESAKRAHGLGAPADILRAAFSSPDAARAAVDAVRAGGDARPVTLAAGWAERRAETAAAVAQAVGDRPAVVLSGAGARGMHDLLSPAARRLGSRLALLGRGRGPVSEEDAYAGLDRIVAEDPRALDERLKAEVADGFMPCAQALVIQLERVPDTGVDRRAREAVHPLKKARLCLVLVEDDDALHAALDSIAPAVRAAHCITEATAALVPALGRDAASDVLVQLERSPAPPRAVLVTLPSLGLRREDDVLDVLDADAFPFVQAVLRAAARNEGALTLDLGWSVRAVPAASRAALSTACIDLLARLAPLAQPTTARRSR